MSADAARLIMRAEPTESPRGKLLFHDQRHASMRRLHLATWGHPAENIEEKEMLARIRQVPKSRLPELQEKINELVEDMLDEEEDRKDRERQRILLNRVRERDADI